VRGLAIANCERVVLALWMRGRAIDDAVLGGAGRDAAENRVAVGVGEARIHGRVAVLQEAGLATGERLRSRAVRRAVGRAAAVREQGGGDAVGVHGQAGLLALLIVGRAVVEALRELDALEAAEASAIGRGAARGEAIGAGVAQADAAAAAADA